MANEKTLDLLTRTSVKPVYDTIDLSEFNPDMGYRVRVRVNLSRKMRRELDAIPKAPPDGVEDTRTPEEKEDAAAQALEFTRLLVPRDSTGDEPLTPDEWRQFIESGDDNADAAFQTWFVGKVWEKVSGFLAHTAAPRK